MVREIEAPPPPNDSNIRETEVVREQTLVQSPTSEKDREEWMNSLSSMRDSARDGSNGFLPSLELTFGQVDSDPHKGDDDPGSPDTSVEVNGVDSSAPLHAYGYAASVDKVGAERRERLAQEQTGDSTLGAEQQYLAELQALAASAIAGDAASFVSLANSGFASQGLQQVSIYDLKMQKGSDGQVLLVAPRGDGGAPSQQDGVALVRDDGRALSAMELGRYLRPDGTILIGERGQALRPGEELAVAPVEAAENTKSASESGSAEQTLVSEKSELNDITTAAVKEISETKDTQQAGEGQKIIKTRLGETLRSIALRDLNDVKNWQLLAEKNNLSTETDSKGNPLAALQRGMTLTLPTASEIEDFQARASLAASLQLT